MKTREEVIFFCECLKSVSPHYPGFEDSAMQRNIEELKRLALLGVEKLIEEKFQTKKEKS